MRSLRHELRYDAATLEQVYAMLGDAAFREQVCDRQRAASRKVVVTPAGAGGLEVVIEQARSADGVPGFARSFVGEEITTVQQETWTSPAEPAALRLSIPGKPGEITGTVRLEEAAGAVVQQIDLEARVSLPLVGGKVEGLIVDMVRAAYDAEQEVGRSWLAERR